MDRFYKDQEKIFKAKKPESVVGNKFKKEDGSEHKLFSHRSVSYGAPFVDLNELMRLTESGPGVLGKQCVKPHESHVDKDGELTDRFLKKEYLTWWLGYELVFGHVPSPGAEGVVLARDDAGSVRYLLDKSVAKTITKSFKRESTEVNHHSGRTKEQEDAIKEERKKNRALQKAGEQIAPALLDIAKRRFDPRALLLLLKSTYPFSRANDEKLQDMVHRLPELSEFEAMTEMLQVVLLTLLSEKDWIKSKAIAEAARWIGYDIDGALDAILNPPKPEKKTRSKKKKEDAPAEAAGDVASDEEE